MEKKDGEWSVNSRSIRAGVGYPFYLLELQKLVHELHLNNQVIFTRNREDIPVICSVSDIVVLTSIAPVPQGLVIVEALFYGKSVIVSDDGGAAELIINNQCGLKIPPGDVASLTAAIAKLIDGQLHHSKNTNAMSRPLILSEFNPCPADKKHRADLYFFTKSLIILV